eukprot:TRINITY_DN1261_c0_g1_i1.p1 TRINITY_DN1261_c0_g1~~TRINITY_DN1261_c0_g1_i1.p1  ORF type:complete len:217 (+),score=53.73 TRINITY_DN1261_c0_g1_i1:346-996(+)
MMMNLQGKTPVKDAKGLMVPLENYGLKVMSMGNLVDPESPMIWRGPMVGSAVDQLLHKVAWGPLDILVVDLPPGTGDAQLTISQSVQLSGAVIVSTPQDVALIDARRGANMFKQVDVPLFGLVENMSVFVCPCCSTKTHIFGDRGVQETAKKLGLDFLGDIPIDTRIREGADAGQPVIAALPESDSAKAYLAVAQQVLKKLAVGQQRAPPKITVMN